MLTLAALLSSQYVTSLRSNWKKPKPREKETNKASLSLQGLSLTDLTQGQGW